MQRFARRYGVGRNGRAVRYLLVAAALACGPSGPPPAGPGLPGGPIPPPAGETLGSPASKLVGPAGDTLFLTSAGGASLTVVIPPGALSTEVDVTLTEISSTALGAVGSAYRLEPATLPLTAAITLTFMPPTPGPTVDALTSAYQDTLGYWFRVYHATRDTTAGTLSVQTSRGGDWSLVTVATQRDLHGPFRLDSTMELPFTARGDVVLQFLGEDPVFIAYAPTGEIRVDTPTPKGAASCSPTSVNPLPIHATLAEIKKTAVPVSFRWGINGQWTLSCDDGSTEFISTGFDTLGINHLRCTREYLGLPDISDTHVRGQYRIDCGSGRTVTGTWDLVPPDQTPGVLP